METMSEDFDENISMESLLESAEEVEAGKIINGDVVSVDKDFAYVHIGGKTEGRVPLSEYNEVPEVGSKTDIILKSKKLQDGMYVLSHRAARARVSWTKFKEWYDQGNSIIKARINNLVNKGAVVIFGENSAFLPLSQAGDIRLKDVAGTDNEFEMKILSIDEKKQSILVSRKVILEEKKEQAWKNIVSEFRIGDVISGTVARFVEFGAFVNIEGYDALLHNNDFSWNKVYKKKKLLTIGEEKQFRILNINEEERKVSLGLKQMIPDPWSDIDARYKENDKVSGEITTVTNFGVFVEIEDGIEGLVNANEIAWLKKNVNPKDLYKSGDKIDATILGINQEERRLALGIKQLTENPWDNIEDRIQAGKELTRKIKKVVNFGIFVELEEDIDGMIHVSDLSWDDIKNPVNKYKVGEDITFKVLDINKAEMKISCGVKQLTVSPWQKVKEKYQPRTRVNGVISNIAPFGMFVKLEDDVEGLVHISEVSKQKVEDINDLYNVGDSVKAVVLDVNVDKKRLSLSVKHLEIMEEKEELKKIMGSDAPKTTTIGELLKLKKEEE